MAAVLLRTVLSRRNFSRATARLPTLAGARHPNRLAFSHLGRRPRHVETRPRPLSSGRRLNYFLADYRETTRHPWFARFQAIVALPSSSNPHPTETRRLSPFHSLNSAVIGFGSSIFPFG